MNFYKWKLKWDDKQGFDPTSLINNNTTRVEPMFAGGDETNPDTFYYAKLIKGVIDIANYSDFSMAEVTSEEVLAEALKLDLGVTMGEEGPVFPQRTRYPIN